MRTIRFLAGLAAGVWLWLALTPVYDHVLASATEPLLHVDRRLASSVLVAEGRNMRVTSSTPLPFANIPADQLTYNVILLCALFAANASPWRGRNLRGFAISLAILAAFHIIALMISIESTYAVRMGPWSEQHYSDFAANAWTAAELVLRVVGMFGIAFGCWWALRPEGASAA